MLGGDDPHQRGADAEARPVGRVDETGCADVLGGIEQAVEMPVESSAVESRWSRTSVDSTRL